VSDLYRLALALRSSDDTALGVLVHERALSLADFKDFFDLAQAILQPKSKAMLAAAATKTQLAGAISLSSEEKVSKEQIELLAKDFLIWSEKEPIVFDWLQEQLAQNPRTSTLAVVDDVLPPADQDSIDRDCGIHAFEAMQAITELIFDFDQNLVREVSKASMGLPDIKRLCAHLGKPKEYVRAIFELAKLAGLIALADKRFQPTDLADSWIAATQKSRWEILVRAWLELVGTAGTKELSSQLAKAQSRLLPKLISSCFPLAASYPASRINRLAELADVIGLSAAGQLASWFDLALSPTKLAAATKALERRLPAQQERIIIQGDLSIIAPGPLASSIEIALRKFADTENIGLASGYRISAQSLSVGLEEGLTQQQIRSLLEKLSGSALPQPVDYLITESASRFGRLKIRAQDQGSSLSSTDELLAKQILMDSKLKHLMLQKTGDLINSPLDSESLYHGLRSCSYLAVRVDELGNVIAPSSIHKSNSEVAAFRTQLDRLRQQDMELTSEAPTSDLERKIQLALRSKSSLQVELNANGKLMSYLLEPIGMANGRLRARDRKADIERTLPISAITSITIG
jgi:hypothetical protein